jgi:hypothetical protein
MGTVPRLPRDELLEVEEILRQLHEGPGQIEALTAMLSPAALRERPAPDEWSINENLAHLRASADVWGTYIARIVVEDHPTFTAASPRAHMRKADYAALEFVPSFGAYVEQRRILTSMLDDLTPADWARSAAVRRNGELWEYSVRYYGSSLASHEAAHIPQIEATALTVAS